MNNTMLMPNKGIDLYNKAKTIIPGGTQLLSKRPEMFLPDLWPAYFSKAKGCKTWDLDGNEYIDACLMGVGANVLGFANDRVDDAVIKAIRNGSNTSLNSPLEVELTEKLLGIHPWADSARYTKTGGEAMAVAVRIARAKTGKSKVLFCGYHGWHDWYLSSNLSSSQSLVGHLLPGLEPNGVPKELLGTSFPFTYNDTKGFEQLFNEHKDDLACVVLESVRNFDPDPNFFECIKKLCAAHGVVIIMDEITACFRLNIGGAHLRYGFEPDIAVFGKALTNGYPLAAVLGKKQVMDAAQSSFISSLFWTESTGLAAAIETINLMEEIKSDQIVLEIGNLVRSKWKSIASELGIGMNVAGNPGIQSFSLELEDPLVCKTFISQEMLQRGYFAATAFYASVAHKDFLEGYFTHLKAVLQLLKEKSLNGTLSASLKGPVCHAGFKRLT